VKYVALLALLPAPALADIPVVETAWLEGNTVHGTLTHPDTGWDHYADGWEVQDQDGNRLGLRFLTHPHVNEQPFTRSLTLDAVPEGPLTLRTRCKVDGWGAATVPVSRD